MNFINKILFKFLLLAKQNNLYYELCYCPDESSFDLLETNILSQDDYEDVIGKKVLLLYF
ncbi:hypothetical protein KLO14_18600 [Clostridioides difficile]|nr:hypothetical protein [Clostridioides difficile]